MRLNVDVLRDVLLYLEKNLKVELTEYDEITSNSVDPWEIPKDEKRFGDSKPEAVLYAVRMLSDAGLINPCVTVGAGGEWQFSMIYDITFAGHEFLECVRNSTTWGKTKEIAKKTGCQSVAFLGQVASSVLSGLISSHIT